MLFDVGGVVGGILVGYILDKMNVRVIIVVGFMYCVILVLFFYWMYGSVFLMFNIVLMVIVGMLINGFYVFIMIVVFVDLGMYSLLKGNGRVLVIVIVIIDGIGFFGVVIGFLFIGFFLS